MLVCQIQVGQIYGHPLYLPQHFIIYIKPKRSPKFSNWRLIKIFHDAKVIALGQKEKILQQSESLMLSAAKQTRNTKQYHNIHPRPLQ